MDAMQPCEVHKRKATLHGSSCHDEQPCPVQQKLDVGVAMAGVLNRPPSSIAQQKRKQCSQASCRTWWGHVQATQSIQQVMNDAVRLALYQEPSGSMRSSWTNLRWPIGMTFTVASRRRSLQVLWPHMWVDSIISFGGCRIYGVYPNVHEQRLIDCVMPLFLLVAYEAATYGSPI